MRAQVSIVPLSVLLAAFVPRVFAATLVVPTQFATIQSAINAAQPLDDVVVEPGTYSENLTLRSQVNVVGRETARTLLQPATATQPTVLIRVASNVRFSNFTLTGAATAVSIVGSASVQITNVVFESVTGVGVDASTSTATIANDVFFSNALAIRRDSVAVQVTNNIFRSNTATVRSLNLAVNNNVAVTANCWSNNTDLLVGGVDGGYGTQITLGDPLFVAETTGDFHLKQGSPCIDAGTGTDVIDNTVADTGAYGGQFADARPMPVTGVTVTDTSGAAPAITVGWAANQSYLVTNTTLPGGYNVYYKQNASGPPYTGTDAGGGTQRSPVDAGGATTFTLANLAPQKPSATTTQLVGAAGKNLAVELTWAAAPGASGYRVHYGVASTAESQTDVGNVTSFIVSGLTNGMTYRFAVGTLTRAVYYVVVTARDSTPNRNESVFSAEHSIEIGAPDESPLSNELTAAPDFTTAYPVLPNQGGCFIATAAYGADWQAEVLALRDFRDRFLLRNAAGRWFVARYYELSPGVADYIREHSATKPLVRALLTPLVVVALFLLGSGVAAKAGTGILLLALVVARHRRKRLVDGANGAE